MPTKVQENGPSWTNEQGVPFRLHKRGRKGQVGAMFELFHSKNAQALATWIALLTAFFAGIGKLIPEWFGQLSWPQLILASFGAALATLLLLSIAAFFAGAGAAFYRRFRPLAPLSSSEVETGTVAYNDAEQEIERLKQNHDNLRDRFVELAAEVRAAIGKQTALPLLQGRHTNAKRDHESADRWLEMAEAGCRNLAGFIEKIKGGEHANSRGLIIKASLQTAIKPLRDALPVENEPDWTGADRLILTDCEPKTRSPRSLSDDSIRFDLAENALFIACLENNLQRGLNFATELKNFSARRKRKLDAIGYEIEAELRRIRNTE